MRGSKGGGGGPDITGNEKNSYFFIFVHFNSYTLYVKVGPPPPWKIFWIRVCESLMIDLHW